MIILIIIKCGDVSESLWSRPLSASSSHFAWKRHLCTGVLITLSASHVLFVSQWSLLWVACYKHPRHFVTHSRCHSSPTQFALYNILPFFLCICFLRFLIFRSNRLFLYLVRSIFGNSFQLLPSESSVALGEGASSKQDINVSLSHVMPWHSRLVHLLLPAARGQLCLPLSGLPRSSPDSPPKAAPCHSLTTPASGLGLLPIESPTLRILPQSSLLLPPPL
jgi:hypothetical protein